MKAKEKARDLFDKYAKKFIDANSDCWTRPAKECAIISVDEKYSGIINVIVDLKGRGELSDKIYLKALDDINEEWQDVKREIESL